VHRNSLQKPIIRHYNINSWIIWKMALNSVTLD